MLSRDRFALFIDGRNLCAAAKSIGLTIDYKRLLEEFSRRGRMTRAFYYTAVDESNDDPVMRALVDWLDYNGFSVVAKPAKAFIDRFGHRRVRASTDIELVVDALAMAKHLDHAVLFSGDGNFRALVEALQRKGVRVSVVSTIKGQNAIAASELRRQADEFIDLTDLAPELVRNRAQGCDDPHGQRDPSEGARALIGSQGMLKGRPAPQAGAGEG